jgi:NADP-dependent alcohol dehydrogenase
MNNFLLSNPTRIRFGEGQVSSLSKEIPKTANLLITIGGGSIKKNGILDAVLNSLKDYKVSIFEGIEANPEFDTLVQAIDLGKKESVDYILAVGGGSVLDGSKLIAAGIANSDIDPWEIVTSGGRAAQTALPIGTVLTLPATGSESNGNAVISRRATGDKLGIASPLFYPQFAILDPTYTYSLDSRQLANGVVDAFVHTMEQYLTYPVNAKIQDRFAEGILSTLIEEGPKALQEPENYDIRANIMWSATMALNGLIGAGVPQDWATHMIGHEITAEHGLDHAQTLAIVLPSLMTHQKESKREKLKQYAEKVWSLDPCDEQSIDRAIRLTRDFFEKMGTSTSFTGYGIDEPNISQIISKLEEHGMTALGEHQKIDLKASREILEAAR